ncbi:SDR family oxidoreductase [Nocardioides sp. GY 10127]|uniref:SDR family oxidoreductase n=1 Tax=Nocardioides sp. GY 10127 TaxID=2569762 RepID=UPI0010A8655A|nr:SDR family oxidoreductase [Nocardioides sp. GY 10127]TIC79301.1 SDR family oxidoreductase [Nocardioides sp. GY 10127]
MDLGLTGRTAFVAASSQGLGLACARSLAREGAHVWLNGRDEKKLADAAARLRAELPGAVVAHVAADLVTDAGRAAILEAVPAADVLVTNNAGPRPGALEDWDAEALRGAVDATLVPAVELIRAYVPGMRERRFGRIVNITSAMVKSPAADMGLSTSARAALTAIAKSVSKAVAIDNVTVNNLLPERIDSPRQEFMIQRRMAAEGVDHAEARRRIASTIAAGRLGTPEEFGDACAYLCSAQAGYVSGQNLQLDGGSYEGLI